jgi:intergrase/recombinase
MDFLCVSGLRLNEAVESYNLIVKLHREGKLAEYYNSERQSLEHYRYPSLFIRKTKKCFVSIIPKTLVDKITFEDALLKGKMNVQKLVQVKRLPLRFSDVREAWNSYMNKWLTREELDFLNGRVSGSIFQAHYFNVALISDLQKRTLQGAMEILNKIS